ncbi:hypothetical protein Tco_1388345, partial [Tanacetum coccineum]
NNDNEQVIAEIFRIETNLFDYETPLCTEFKEFNFLLKVDQELFTHDIERTKTYKDYENELNDELEEAWSEDGVPYEIYGLCNGGVLPGMVRVGYMTYFQDFEWYNELADGNLKEEALKKKAIFERSWGDASQSVINIYAWLKRDHIRGQYANFFTTYDPHLDINSIFGMNNNASNISNVQDEELNESCNLFNDTAHNASICKIRRFEMIKYSFGQDEEYVAIKECEYDDLTKTNEDACRAYQEIFRSMDERWVVTRAE